MILISTEYSVKFIYRVVSWVFTRITQNKDTFYAVAMGSRLRLR